MYTIISILFIIVGIFVFLKPNAAIEFINMFKFDYIGEPSDLYVFSTRFGGLMFAIVGFLYIIAEFIL